MSKKDESLSRIEKFFSPPNLENEKKNAHLYKHEKIPPIPRGIRKTPQKLKKAQVVKGKNTSIYVHTPPKILQQKKERTYKVNERLIAARNLKKLSFEMQKWIYVHLHQEYKQLGKEKLDLHDFIERGEERTFQIDRIIKYLDLSN